MSWFLFSISDFGWHFFVYALGFCCGLAMGVRDGSSIWGGNPVLARGF